jgi:FMN-dependent NADH-azoreductase
LFITIEIIREVNIMKILHVIANPKPVEEANSKQLTEAFLKELKKNAPDATITTVDLYLSPPPYYSYNTYRHFWYPIFNQEYKPSKEEIADSAYALEQGKIFNDTDVLVITSPMWNFTVPAILKAWQDQVLSPGLTFSISTEGVKPLHHVKKIILLLSSGGVYGEDDRKNNLVDQIKTAFGFVRINDLDYAWADGQNTFFFKDYQERKENAMKKAEELGREVASLVVGAAK